jgi:hypothetical protein
LVPGSEIRDPGWVKIRIRDTHPGSATLKIFNGFFDGSFDLFKEKKFSSLRRDNELF